MGKYYELYKKYEDALDGKSFIIRNSNDKFFYIGRSAIAFKNIYSVNITPDNLNGVGANSLTQSVATTIFGNFKSFQNFFDSTLRLACSKAINQLLPAVKDIKTNDVLLDQYLNEFKGLQTDIQTEIGKLNSMTTESPGYNQQRNTVALLKIKSNQLLTKITSLIELLQNLCLGANNIIKEIWALNGDSSSEIASASINYKTLYNNSQVELGTEKINLIKYSDVDLETFLDQLESENMLLYPPDGQENVLPGGIARYYKNGDEYIVVLPGGMLYTTNTESMTKVLLEKGFNEEQLNFLMKKYYGGTVSAVNNENNLNDKTKALLELLYTEMYSNPSKALLIQDGKDVGLWRFYNSDNRVISTGKNSSDVLKLKEILTLMFNASLESNYRSIDIKNDISYANTFALVSTLTPFIRTAYHSSVSNTTNSMVGYDSSLGGFVCNEYAAKIATEIYYGRVRNNNSQLWDQLTNLTGDVSNISREEIRELFPKYFSRTASAINFTNNNFGGTYRGYDASTGNVLTKAEIANIQSGSFITRDTGDNYHVIYVVNRYIDPADNREYLLYADSSRSTPTDSAWNSNAGNQANGPRLRVVAVDDLNTLNGYNYISSYIDARET